MASPPPPVTRRVLVVDDDPVTRTLCGALLREAGWQVVPVLDAPSYAGAFAGRYDAVVVADGLGWAPASSLLEASRSSPVRRPVVCLVSRDELVADALRRGFDDALARTPSGFVSLPATLDKACRPASPNVAPDALARLLDRLDRATFRCGPDGRIVDANRAFVELLGLGLREDALHANAWDLLLPVPLRASLPTRLAEVPFLRETGIAVTSRDGIPLRVDLAFARESDGTIVGLVERAGATSQKPPAPDERLEQALSVAHDLKEPLRTLVRSTRLLRERLGTTVDADSAEELAFVDDAAGRLQQRVRALFEKPETTASGPLQPEPDVEPVGCDAEVVFREVLAALKGSIESAKAKVTHDPLPEVALGADQLLPLLQNLVGNAVKFRRPGVSPRVHVGAERRDGEWLFSVSDDGIGIAPEHQEKVFEMFQRGTAGAKYPGSGIGLSVCKRIVERHGGRIWLHATAGEGTTFFFTLPAVEETASDAPAPPIQLRPKKADIR